jgi:hypothetical protein
MAVVILLGCSSDENSVAPTGPKAPTLPPVSTMRMDISLFESADVPPPAVQAGGITADAAAFTAEGSQLNFLNAAVRVLYLDLVVYSALADPVAAFAVAAHSVPQPQPDSSYLWTYIVVDDEIDYSIYLYGKDHGDHVSWRMEVSSTDPELPLDHFVWFEGVVSADGASGYWQFYEPVPQGPAMPAFATPGVAAIRIDWSVSGAAGQLVFTVIRAGDPAEGSTLTFNESPESCSIEFYDAEAGTSGVIVWYEDGSGYIEWPDYHNGERRCWDEDQFDDDCIL